MLFQMKSEWNFDPYKERIVTYFFEEDELPYIYGYTDKIPVQLFGGDLEIGFTQIAERIKAVDL